MKTCRVIVPRAPSNPVYCGGAQGADSELTQPIRSHLDQILDRRQEVFGLAGLIGGETFVYHFGRFYRPLRWPAKPTPLKVGLSYLQHTLNLSDAAEVQG